MSGFGPGGTALADCPARLAVEVIVDKWTVVVLYGLGKGPVGHGELIELIGGISRKVLTRTLRRLEAHGLVLPRLRRGAAPCRVQAHLARGDADRTDPHADRVGESQRRRAVLDALDAGPEPAAPGHRVQALRPVCLSTRLTGMGSYRERPSLSRGVP
ncbi:winged helix-turn-helix transcriptional regulator [Embleya sp. NPDC059237]|uniref:winged helix-turn-helix transcriptional regulator n=1 Tax=Embleya sp. NPDC059237 TaxID=3346784 RepID=UPI0036BC80A7